MRTKSFIAAIGAALLLGSCDTKDPIHETDHPEKAKITVTTDWSEIGKEITKPSEYIAAYGSEKLTADKDEYTFPNLLEEGSYTVYFYNEATGITVAGSQAKVNTAAAPAGQSGAFVEPAPGWLFTGKLEAEVKKDTHHRFDVKMAQQVRQLTLEIEPTGSAAGNIAGITASLSGVAGSYDMADGTHGSPSNVALNFTEAANGKWTATVQLLGVTGSQQKLTGTITLTGGSPADMPLESDLTAKLSSFNDNKNEPLTLGGTIVQTPTGFTATITDWTKVDGGDVIAE